MTYIQKAKEIAKSFFDFMKLNSKEFWFDQWLATPEAAALLSGEDWKEDAEIAFNAAREMGEETEKVYSDEGWYDKKLPKYKSFSDYKNSIIPEPHKP